MQQKVRVYSTYLVFGLIEQVALWKVGKLVQDLNELIKDLFFFKTQAMRTLGKTLSFHGVMIKSHAPVLRYIATHIIPLDMSSCIFLTVYQQGSNSSICRLMSYWWCQGVNSFIVFPSAQLHQLPDWARTSPGAVSYQKAMGIYWNTCPGPSEHSESETMGNNSSAPLKSARFFTSTCFEFESVESTLIIWCVSLFPPHSWWYAQVYAAQPHYRPDLTAPLRSHTGAVAFSLAFCRTGRHPTSPHLSTFDHNASATLGQRGHSV
jgi:hypothetical protein